jgi:hypothetical protein
MTQPTSPEQRLSASAFERPWALKPAVVAVAVVWTVLDWSLAITSWLAIQAYQSHRYSFANQVANIAGVSGWLDFVVSVAAFILTGIWLARARRNADRIAPGAQRRNKMWVWVGWLVPIVQLWYPKQVIDDVWRGTARKPGQPNTGWWWGTWIAFSLLSTVTQLWAPGIEEQTQDTTRLAQRMMWTQDLGWLDLLTALAMTIALPLWIRVVRAISADQAASADVEESPLH